MSQSHPSGLLTDHEREILTGDHPDADTQRDGVLEAVSTRLPDALVDLMSLYLYLDDDELETVMTGGAESSRSFRAPAQYAYAALYTGLQLTGDDPEHRLVSAIKQAEAAHQRHAQVDLSITTEPFLPPEDRLAALERGDGDRVSIEALEHLFLIVLRRPTILLTPSQNSTERRCHRRLFGRSGKEQQHWPVPSRCTH